MTFSSNLPPRGHSPFARFSALLALCAALVWPCANLQAQGVADLAPPPIGGSPTPRAIPPPPMSPQPTPAHEEIPIPALTPQPAQPAQPTQPVRPTDLIVTLPPQVGTAPPLPTRIFDGVPYLADKDLLRLARAMDPAATQQPNVAQATLDLTIAKEKIFLFLKYKSVQINETLIDANEPLRVEGGQYFIPLRSLLVILDHYQGVKSNIPELLTAPAAPPVPTPAVPPPTGVVPAPPIGVSTPPLPASAPGLGLAPPPLPDSLQADPRDISEALLSVMGTDTAENATFRGSLKLTTAPLIARRFIVLDPQTGPNALGSTADAPPSDLIFQIATRCRDLLAQAQTVEVYVVTKSASENPTPDQRLASLNTVGGKALVSLRLDWSPFEDNRGYRIFTAHESVDSEGLESLRPIAATPGAIPPPPAPAYLPYDRISLVLAHLLDLQMKRINRIPPASSQSIKQAPFYLLKRTGMPAATLSLGYWSNPADRSYLSTQDFVEESAHALARTIVLYDRWLRQIQEEPGA